MPYPNEHACRLADPGQFVRIRSEERKHKGKIYRVLYGFLRKGGSKEQAYRYPKGSWTAGEARRHCQSHGGRFEAAGGGE